MNSINRDIQVRLRSIIYQYGRDLVRKPSLCDAYLADLLPMYPKTRRYLIKALQSGIVNRMLPEPDPSQFATLGKHLGRITGLEYDEAQEIVEYWGYALASHPEVIMNYVPAQPKPKWVVKKSVAVPVLGALGLLLVAWGANQYLKRAPTNPAPAQVSDLMTGGKPVFVEAVELPKQPANVAKPSPTVTYNLQSALPLTQVSVAIAADRAPAPSVTALNQKLMELARPTVALANAEGLDNVPSPERQTYLKQAQRLSREAVNALQRFREQAERFNQKQAAKQSLATMWALTQEPYYQQQQITINEHLNALDQQIGESLQSYNAAIGALCSLVQGDASLVTSLQGTQWQNLVTQQLTQCQSTQTLSRELLAPESKAVL